MEEEYGPFSWAYYYQEEGIEELKHSLLYTTLELETTIVSAHEQLARKGDELMHLKNLLTKTIKERDDAQAKCQRLIVEKFMLQQQLQASPLISNTEDEPARKGESATGLSSSGCDENFTASTPPPLPLSPLQPPPPLDVTEKLVTNRALPEKGKFLQAVMEAGPLLQTLLLAGPLPQWQHPPPQLNSIEIPPVSPKPPLLHQDSCVSTTGCFSKRGLDQCEDFEFSPSAKNQKIVHQSPLTNI